MASQGHFIHLFAGDAKVLGNEFRRVAHDVGFADKQAQRRPGLVHRPLFGMGNDVGNHSAGAWIRLSTNG